MTYLNRQLLFLLLALLQFIAPLVHAHTQQSFSSFGLHVPGLEAYEAEQLSALVPMSCQYSNLDGLMVGVDIGIRQSRDNQSVANGNDCPVMFSIALPKSAVSRFSVNFSPQTPVYAPSPNLSLQAPRAPPVISLL